MKVMENCVKTICSVCGCSGVGTIETHVASWFNKSYHRDPRVCAANLMRKSEELDRREKDLKRREQEMGKKESLKTQPGD